MSTPVATSTAHPLIGKHQQTLDRALQAIRDRGYWSAYAESPSPRQYGEAAAEAGRSAFEGRLGQPLQLGQPGVTGLVGEELSPYGLPMGITYPHVTDIGALLGAMRAAMPAWRDAGPELRAAVCAEILERINQRSFEMAHAVMHTTGQAFVMAFQAGGPHAQDRALEAVAYGYDEMRRVPRSAYWEKPQGKRDPLRMRKDSHIVPRGIALVIGCNTFPTWNAYPGLFASLVTGNPVLVKPHPRAILPLALTV
jgi:phenylacetic acid degradation protein paaN